MIFRRMPLREWPRRLRAWFLEDGSEAGLGGPPNRWAQTGWFFNRPGDSREMQVKMSFVNDAFEVWIATKWEEKGHKDEKWAFSCRAETFRTLAVWYLWRWAWGEWFGLRRRLYYWWLRRWVKHNVSGV